ncbi:MAG TPA: zinc ribbon domain-containing protein [Gemmatimonadales bacterium]|nr:zinc ribbon domain-containing protein [Gemmatimonadales bacterium]
MTCHACGATLSDGARYCHKCGASTSAPATGWRVGLPWGITGLAVGALIGVLVMRGSGAASGPVASDTPAAPAAPFAGGGTTGGVAAPDISQMSPEERAQRLFDRVMRLDEAGKSDSVQFFLPMALGAYQQLPALSLDAHFDVGLLKLAGGDAGGALAQADTIRREVPTHLFADILRARALEAQRNARGARAAYQSFLKNEASERARRRPEYADRSGLLDAFHSEAVTRAK